MVPRASLHTRPWRCRPGALRLRCVSQALSTNLGVSLPRGMVIADAWAQLGAAVSPLSNSSGRPLARTVKLILDPLILRPVQNPHFAGAAIAIDHVDALRDSILDAGPLLAATSDWFRLIKRARRKAKITDGNPQDLYFQHCYELAHLHGAPEGVVNATALADEVVTEVQDLRGDKTVGRLRDFVTDPGHAAELSRLLETVWRHDAHAENMQPPSTLLADFLADCATRPDSAAFAKLSADRIGTSEASELRSDGTAQEYGLTAHRSVRPPTLGDRASKSRLPKPFDRSILERTFASFTTIFQRESMEDIPRLVVKEIHRSAAPWQLSEETSRVTMALGRDASTGLTPQTIDTDIPRSHPLVRLRSRWQRQPYVHRALRLPDATAADLPEDLRSDITVIRRPYLRRLWVRLHGRELRGEQVDGQTVWDLLDGVLRSVIMDQRDRLRGTLERSGEPS